VKAKEPEQEKALCLNFLGSLFSKNKMKPKGENGRHFLLKELK